MAWIVDVELVEIAEDEPPDIWTVVFDVIYPGETWCRSLVRLTSDFIGESESTLVGRARDALLVVLEQQAGPASADIRLSEKGVTILHLGSPDLS